MKIQICGKVFVQTAMIMQTRRRVVMWWPAQDENIFRSSSVTRAASQYTQFSCIATIITMKFINLPQKLSSNLGTFWNQNNWLRLMSVSYDFEHFLHSSDTPYHNCYSAYSIPKRKVLTPLRRNLSIMYYISVNPNSYCQAQNHSFSLSLYPWE